MTQLWEPCPVCGCEPVYMENGGYCEKHGYKTGLLKHAVEIKTEIYGDEYEKQDKTGI